MLILKRKSATATVDSDSVGLGLDVKFYICKQFSVDDGIFGPRTTLLSSKHYAVLFVCFVCFPVCDLDNVTDH